MKDYRIKSIEAVKPNAKDSVLNYLGIIIGFGIAVSGAVMCITIVLFIPGIIVAALGGAIIALSAPKANVECTECGTINAATMNFPNMKCSGCETTIPITWINEKAPGN